MKTPTIRISLPRGPFGGLAIIAVLCLASWFVSGMIVETLYLRMIVAVPCFSVLIIVAVALRLAWERYVEYSSMLDND